MKEYNPDERPIKMEMKPFCTEYITDLMAMPIQLLWPAFEVIAVQNDLNLMYVKDFEKARDILFKSVILN